MGITPSMDHAQRAAVLESSAVYYRVAYFAIRDACRIRSSAVILSPALRGEKENTPGFSQGKFILVEMVQIAAEPVRISPNIVDFPVRKLAIAR